jgi:hypothetical protein
MNAAAHAGRRRAGGESHIGDADINCANSPVTSSERTITSVGIVGRTVPSSR